MKALTPHLTLTIGIAGMITGATLAAIITRDVQPAATPFTQIKLCEPRDRCTPPATFRFDGPPPFDAPVRFGGEISAVGGPRWVWLKDGEPSSRGCDKREPGVGDEAWAQMLRACDAKVGDVLYTLPRFRVVAQ